MRFGGRLAETLNSRILRAFCHKLDDVLDSPLKFVGWADQADDQARLTSEIKEVARKGVDSVVLEELGGPTLRRS